MIDVNDDFDKIMKKMFDGNDLLKNMFGMQINPEDMEKKSYSISYKFNTGMDKPEIKISGDITPKDAQKIIGGKGNFLPSNFPMKEIPSLPTNLKSDKAINKDIVDIFEEGDELHIVLETPGLEKEELDIQANFNEIEINGKSIKLPVKIQPDTAKSTLRNGILQIKFKKDTEEHKEIKKTIEIE